MVGQKTLLVCTAKGNIPTGFYRNTWNCGTAGPTKQSIFNQTVISKLVVHFTNICPQMSPFAAAVWRKNVLQNDA